MTAEAPDQALVLTAGTGQRLRPLSQIRAKPAVPVAGEPLIRRVLRWLARQGVDHAVLNLHHRPESITRVVGDGTGLGLRVRYAWEPRLLGSAGGPRAMMPLLERRSAFIVNGDTLSDMSLAGLAAEHRSSGAQVTLAVTDNPDRRRYGGVIVDDAGWIRRFLPAPHDAPSLHYVGIQMVEPDVFETLPAGEPVSTIGGVYSDLASGHDDLIRAHRVNGRFLDVGTPVDYLTTSLALAADEGQAALPAGSNSRIDPSSRLVRTAVWDDVVIGAACELVDCIVTDGVHVPARTRLERKILLCERGSHKPVIAPLSGGPEQGMPEAGR